LVFLAASRPKEIFETREINVAYATYQETQVTLAKSRKVIEAVLTQDSVAKLTSVRKQEDPVDPQLTELVGASFGVAPLEYRPCCENSIEHGSPVTFLLVGFVASNVSTRTL
jgi:hypothetical protein